MTEKGSKSKALNELEKKLSKQRKQKSEDLIKKKLDKKELDYDTISLILGVFGKSKFQWQTEYFEDFDSTPNRFRGKELPNNNRECVMLGIKLGTMRGNIAYNLRGMSLTEEYRSSIDDLVWNLVWYQWQEARMLYDFTIKENKA